MLESVTQKRSAVKLAIAVPSLGTWRAEFGLAFANMACFMCGSLFEADQDRSIVVLTKKTSMLPRSRHEALADALMQGCTHLLFLDSDQTFPPDICHKLMAHKKPVVAANIALKVMPSFPNARGRGPTAFGVPITSDPWKHGLEKVWRVGSGIMLIDLSIMEKIPKPWFEIRWNKDEEQYVGEDWFFCEQVEKAGFDIFIDHDVSRTVGHEGDFTYTHQHIPQIEEERKSA